MPSLSHIIARPALVYTACADGLDRMTGCPQQLLSSQAMLARMVALAVIGGLILATSGS